MKVGHLPGRGYTLAYEQELEKRTGGARSSLIDKRVPRLWFSPIISRFPVEWSLTRVICLPRFVGSSSSLDPYYDGGDESSRNLVAADFHLRSGRDDHNRRIWDIMVISNRHMRGMTGLGNR